ncbi:MAG TPA: DUF721 domain-containing protein [Candidatus Portnoybacteria bacterium]|nr:DUF721 domain-containing protein [Candidatus Portnoybacteria bacterium]
MLIEIKKTLPTFLKRINLDGKKQESNLIKNWDSLIQEILGDRFANQSVIQAFKEDLLIVECFNSVWAQEFKFREKEIIKKVNQYFRKNKINRIKFVW